MPLKKLKQDKTKNYIGQAAIFDDEQLDCQFILIAPTTGNIQRLFARFCKHLVMDTTKCKSVKVIPQE